MTKAKLTKIWESLNENERYGLSFGLFPARIMSENLTNQESAELIQMSQTETGVEY